MRSRAQVIAIFGPTAIGKTAVAIAFAELLRSRGQRPLAISADALQLYRGIEILSGAPSAQERARLEHRLVSIAPLGERFSAGRYSALAHASVDEALAAGMVPIVVGGTGLYLRAALADLDLRPPTDPQLRARLQAQLDACGPEALHGRLARLAPDAAARIDRRDRQRIVRALELIEAGRRPPEPAAREAPGALWSAQMRRPTLLIGLVTPLPELYARVHERVRTMLAQGAREEVLRAEQAGASAAVRKAIGYRELLAGDEQAMELATRRYARRQLTWMRKLAGARLIDVTGRQPEVVAQEIAAIWERGG
ncbi:MAG TPA: tRNA (adenosine(37)-N6)-dimethylallyltransferase MiaA [Solirubrobacteraceae bacterium]|nr:tRNA (adenosine(37)-N6)-dimethylallyltransferase MiaA [Solirubrobacteraceae bacterium]